MAGAGDDAVNSVPHKGHVFGNYAGEFVFFGCRDYGFQPSRGIRCQEQVPPVTDLRARSTDLGSIRVKQRTSYEEFL
jgi:hypothetical protein